MILITFPLISLWFMVRYFGKEVKGDKELSRAVISVQFDNIQHQIVRLSTFYGKAFFCFSI